jgi:hypothetical protein
MGAIPSAAWTLCRLRAGPDTLAERILLRGRGGRPAIPGDEMRGRPEAELRGRIAEASRIADALDHASVGGLCVDTDGIRLQSSLTSCAPWPAVGRMSPEELMRGPRPVPNNAPISARMQPVGDTQDAYVRRQYPGRRAQAAGAV